jgi:HEPN domain-containing protein
MRLQDAYIETASRSIEIAEILADAGYQEGVAFYAYHAFESLGGALCDSYGELYPSGHTGKINTFMAVAHRCRIDISVGQVAMRVNSVRNQCLYPTEQIPDEAYQTPNQLIQPTDARDMLRRVKGIYRLIRRTIGN